MNYKKKISLLSAFVLAWGSGLWATQTIAGDNAAGSFTSNISAKAFDRSTGNFYVATSVATTTPIFTMAMAGPTATGFTGLALATDAANRVIESNDGQDYLSFPSPLMSFLAGNNDKYLVAITGGTGNNNSVSVFSATTAKATYGNSGALLCVDGLTDIATAAQTSTLRLTTGKAMVGPTETGKAFVYVYPAAGAGDVNSGICSVSIDLATGIPMADESATVLTAGTATPLNVEFLGTGINVKLLGYQASATALTAVANGCFVNDLYWDNESKVLYAGLSVWAEAAANGENFSYALVKTTIDPNTGLLVAFDELSRVTGNHNVSYETGLPVAGNGTTNADTVFAVQSTAAQFNTLATVKKIRGMKTSTGFKYLILNAGALDAGINDLTRLVPTVWAVRVAQEENLPAAIKLGDVIQNTTPAETALGDNWGVTGNPAGGLLGATKVGNGDLPFSSLRGEFVTDMEVIGDTVYASIGARSGIAGTRGDVSDPGVWSSRAMFNQDGIIVGWTKWERVFVSEDDGTFLDAVDFFNADADRGTLWKVCRMSPANNSILVKRTQWTQTTGDPIGTALDQQLNQTFGGDAVTAMLDLPTGTPGIGSDASNSFALFGGNETVVFAQTKSGNVNQVMVDFSPNGNNYLLTTIPGAGYVRSLGYSRSVSAGTSGYFFAGTDKGLYAFVGDTTAPDGFDGATGLTDFTANPFNGNNPGWVKMAATGDNAITGAVTAIESNGNYLFVVEQDVTSIGAIVDKIHWFSIENDVATMETNHGLIAKSGSWGLPANTIFTSIVLVNNDDEDGNNAGLLLATNNGIYAPNETLNDFDPANDQTHLWRQKDADNLYTTLFANKRISADMNQDGGAYSAIGIALTDDIAGSNYYQQGDIKNLGLGFTADVVNTLNPFAYVNATTLPEGLNTTYLQRLSAFWTDGARRFFTTYDPNLTVGNTFKSMPYNTAEWNMTTGPVAITGVTAPTAGTMSINRVNCIESISGLGIVVAGTSDGVVVLE